MANELSHVQPFVEQKLIDLGWQKKQKLSLEPRRHLDEKVLKQKLRELNPGKTEKQINNAIEHLKSLVQLDDVLITLKYGHEGVRFFDFEKPQNNLFYFAREVSFHGGKYRLDFLLFINGIPITVIETKDSDVPIDERDTGLQAMKDIYYYTRHVSELFYTAHIGIGIGNRNYYAAIQPAMKTGYHVVWRDENKQDNIFDLLKPERILDLLQYFTFVYIDDKGEHRIIARWNQYWAAKRVFNRIEKYVTGKSEANTGLIWHWQGAGKTYLMYFIANWYASNRARLGVPHATSFIVVDRRDLQEQHSTRIEKLTCGNTPLEVIRTTKHLVNVLEKLAHGEISGGRIYIVIIHKFTNEEKLPIVPEHIARYTLILRDEAHRTEHGSLMAALEKSLPGSMKFAFTGTPLAMEFTKNEFRDTFLKYSKYDAGKYLHSYFIDDAVKDGVIVPILYRPIKEEYLSVDKEALARELSGHNIEKIMKDINKKLLGTDKFLKKLAKYVVEHLPNDTKRFDTKAMVVVADRNACVRFKKYFDEELRKAVKEGKYPISPNDVEKYSAVVMTYGKKPNDFGDFLEYQKELFDCGGCSENELNERIVDLFNNSPLPKVLIVTDKLLTGFDAPVLKVMYVAKAMDGPRLLQAISRVNRPYKGYTGLIVDAAGILKRILNLYNFYNAKLSQPSSVVFADEREHAELIKKKISLVKNILDVEGLTLETKTSETGYEELNDRDFRILTYRQHILGYMRDLIKTVDDAKFVFEKYATPEEKDFVARVRKELIVYRNQYCRRYPQKCERPEIDFSRVVEFGDITDVGDTIRLFVRDLDESINDEALARTVVESAVERLKKDKRLAAFPEMQKKIATIEKLLEKIEKFEHRHDILRILNEIADFYESIDSPMAYLDALEREYGLKFENTRKLIERGFVPGVDVRRQISFAVLQDLKGNKELIKRFGKIVEGLMSYYQ